MSERQTVVALFEDAAGAQQGVRRLLESGLAAANVGYLAPADVRRRQGHEKRSMLSPVLGALSMGVTGGLVGAFGVGLPGLAGAVLAGAVGIAFGGYAGAIIGGIFSVDHTGEDEQYLLEAVRDGRTLVSAEVAAGEELTIVAAALHESDALEVDSLGNVRLRAPLRRADTIAA